MPGIRDDAAVEETATWSPPNRGRYYAEEPDPRLLRTPFRAGFEMLSSPSVGVEWRELGNWVIADAKRTLESSTLLSRWGGRRFISSDVLPAKA